MTHAPLPLAAGELRVELLPTLGGSIGRFDRLGAGGRQALLRGASASVDDVVDTGCFPLAPYVNRIRGGSFDCDGREVRLTPNLPGDASPLHGQGWRAAWEVEEADERRARLSFRHAADEWPWDYEAEQLFDLDDAGLSLTLSCTNRSPDPMPCGLGFHPYFVCSGDTILDTSVEQAWTVDVAVLPVESVAATGRYDLRRRRICGQSLDNGFDGWDGMATITWPGEPASLRMSSPDAGRFQVYSPPTGGFFAAEPVQNANAALNAPQDQWSELGITMLAQGQRAVLHARFDVVPL